MTVKISGAELEERYPSRGAGLVVRRGDGFATTNEPVPPDPYENPDESPERHHGQPVERVELPISGPTAAS